MVAVQNIDGPWSHDILLAFASKTTYIYNFAVPIILYAYRITKMYSKYNTRNTRLMKFTRTNNFAREYKPNLESSLCNVSVMLNWSQDLGFIMNL